MLMIFKFYDIYYINYFSDSYAIYYIINTFYNKPAQIIEYNTNHKQRLYHHYIYNNFIL